MSRKRYTGSGNPSIEAVESQFSDAQRNHLHFLQRRSNQQSQVGINNGGRMDNKKILTVKKIVPPSNVYSA